MAKEHPSIGVFLLSTGLIRIYRSTAHLLIKANSGSIFHTKSLSCIKTKDNNHYENENYYSQSAICKDQVVPHCINFLCDRYVYFPYYHPSGSMDHTGMWNNSRIVYSAISAILHAQESEEKLNIMLFFQFFGNYHQFFIPFFTELTDQRFV